jgi:hypothetical protein
LEFIIGGTAFRTDVNGRKSLRRPKHSMNEVVAPDEEEENYSSEMPH